ncbi:MAG: Mannosylfructose-phosphate synthase [Parcubacteria group bacterium ADurb.Bin326]|nr:MAG: Mannosylfructose-phosphate synthase [Parcubacteria group bacterium ADurb.Bin326]
MIIGIDASRANKPNKTGTEWYSWHIIEQLKQIADKGDKFLLYANSVLTGGLEKLPDNFVEKDLKWPPKYLWTQIRLWWELWRNPPDVLLVPAHTIPFLPLPKKTRIMVTVHDVGFKRSPQLYKPIQVWYHDLTMRRIKGRADVIITISEFSKQEIIELYQVDEKKIKVIYLGFDVNKFFVQSPSETNQKILEKYNVASPYLLYIGRLEKKKNIANMIAAFALAKESQPDLKLVLAGSAGHQFDDIKKIIDDNKLENEVVITGYVEQADLPVIYNQAEIFLFPTLYEGFGLPILESMASGVPVLTSNFAPHTEVGGEAAYYADPHSPQSLADGIIKILEDSDLKQSLKDKGLVRAKEFSWRRTAEEIYQIVKQ